MDNSNSIRILIFSLLVPIGFVAFSSTAQTVDLSDYDTCMSFYTSSCEATRIQCAPPIEPGCICSGNVTSVVSTNWTYSGFIDAIPTIVTDTQTVINCYTPPTILYQNGTSSNVCWKQTFQQLPAPEIDATNVNFYQTVKNPRLPGNANLNSFDVVLGKEGAFDVTLTGANLTNSATVDGTTVTGPVLVEVLNGEDKLLTSAHVEASVIASQVAQNGFYKIPLGQLSWIPNKPGPLKFKVVVVPEIDGPPVLNKPLLGHSMNVLSISAPKIGFASLNVPNMCSYDPSLKNCLTKPDPNHVAGMQCATGSKTPCDTGPLLSAVLPVPDNSYPNSIFQSPAPELVGTDIGSTFLKVICLFNLNCQKRRALVRDILNLSKQAQVSNLSRLVGIVSANYFLDHGDGLIGGITMPGVDKAVLVKEGFEKTIPHELGHTFGQIHEGYCNSATGCETSSGLVGFGHYLNWPIDGYDAFNQERYFWLPQPANFPAGANVAFSYMDGAELPPVTGVVQGEISNHLGIFYYWSDLNTYELALKAISSLPPNDPETVMVSGVLSDNGEFTFDGARTLSNGVITESQPSGDVSISTIDASGNTTAVVTIQSNYRATAIPGAPDDPASIDLGAMPMVVQIPSTSTAEFIVVRQNGNIIAKSPIIFELLQGIIGSMPSSAFIDQVESSDKINSIITKIQSELESNQPRTAVGNLQNLINEIQKVTSANYVVSNPTQLTQDAVVAAIRNLISRLDPPGLVDPPGQAAKAPRSVLTVLSSPNGIAPLDVVFDSSSSSDPNQLQLSFAWDFGDGTTSTAGGSVSHEYVNSGVYTVTLTVTNSNNLSSSAQTAIVVNNPAPPNAAFVVQPGLNGVAPFTVTFDPSGSSDPQNFPIKYNWDFGDGTTSDSIGTLTHVYTQGGIFFATLTVTNSANISSSFQTAISVLGPPTAYIANESLSSGSAPFTAVLDSRGSFDPQNLPLSYVWDFGDGSVSFAGGVVSHTYSQPGSYTIKLTVTNQLSLSSSAQTSVTVVP